VTIAGLAGALPGTAAGAAKVTPFEVYPPKGRGTGGVRCQRFLRGQDGLVAAWVGPMPARAAGPAGQPVPLPPLDPRRDGSGTPLAAPVSGLG
jgi:DNA gyrase subunit A